MSNTSLRRFFYTCPDLSAPLCSLDQGTKINLSADIFHHWCRVLRASVGDEGILFDGYGTETIVKLNEINKKNATVTVMSHHDVSRQFDINVTIAMVMSRGDRTDYAIQKATELGVTHIQLLSSQYGEVNLKASQIAKKLAHWQQVAISACEQCGLNTPPLVHAPLKIKEWLDSRCDGRTGNAIEGYVLDNMMNLTQLPYYQSLSSLSNVAGIQPIKLILTVPHHTSDKSLDVYRLLIDQIEDLNRNLTSVKRMIVEILIGPEGGFSEVERTYADEAGFLTWQLGRCILRAETAPVVALSALHTLNHLVKVKYNQ